MLLPAVKAGMLPRLKRSSYPPVYSASGHAMQRLRITQVTGRVYCVQRADILSCSYFVVTDDGPVLVDSGMDVEREDMRIGLA